MDNRKNIPLPSYFHNLLSKIDRSIINELIVETINNDEDEKFSKEHFYLFTEFCIILISIPDKNLNNFYSEFEKVKDIWINYLGKKVRKLSNTPKIIDSDLAVIKSIFEKVSSLIGVPNFEKELRSEIAIAKYRIDVYHEPEEAKFRKVIISDKSNPFFKPFANLDENILRR